MHQCGVWTHFYKECSADANVLLAKGPSTQSNDPASTSCIGISKMTILPHSPPHGGMAQKNSDNKIIELIYGKLSISYEKGS